MTYTEHPPEWNDPGAEPPQSKKDSGYQPGDKPPAQWWNWFMNRVYKVLLELQEKALESEALTDHAEAVVLDHPDGSVTDAKIGNRFIDDNVLAGNDGSKTLTEALSMLANMIKQITGQPGWSATPDKTLAELATGLANAAPIKSPTFTGKVKLTKLDSGSGYVQSTYAASVNTATPNTLTDIDGNPFNPNNSYRVTAYVASTGTVTGAVALFLGDGTDFSLGKVFESGIGSNHVEFYLDSGVPKVRLYNHTTLYTVNLMVESLANKGRGFSDLSLLTKAPFDSPSFIGTPTAPTAPTGANTTQLANMKAIQNAAALLVKKTSSTTNATSLNTLVESGFYRLAQNNPDAPPNMDYGQVIVSRGGDTIAQIAISWSSPGTVYVRSGSPTDVGGTGTWTAWIKLATLDAIIHGMYRQSLINGNMDVWQRTNFRANPGSQAFVADRWLVSYFVSAGLPATINHSRLPLTPPELPNSMSAYRVNSSGAGPGPNADDSYGIFQRIENGTRFLCGAGKKLTVSFWGRSNIVGKRIGVYLTQRYGTGSNSPSVEDVLKGKTFTLTADWQQFTLTVDAATLQGKVFGNNNDDYLQLGFFYLWGTNGGTNFFNNPLPTSFQGAGNIDITQVQLSSGENVLAFQPKTYRQEWLDCQRYFQKSFTEGAFSGTNINTTQNVLGGRSIVSGGYVMDHRIMFQTGMRKIPSVSVWSPNGTANCWRIDNAGDVSASVTNQGTNGFTTFVNRAWATNEAYDFHYTADSEIG